MRKIKTAILYEPRVYRNSFNTGRFASFTVNYRDTDLWIGVDPGSCSEDMPALVYGRIRALWQTLEAYAKRQPEFLTSMEPVILLPGAPEAALLMNEAGRRTNTGPMASVAGYFAREAGMLLIRHFSPKELIIENGGDFFLSLQEDLTMTIYAGASPLSEKIAVIIPALETPCGVCTSSGTVGHSHSLGKADAVMAACREPHLADAWATALANQVKTPDDIARVLNYKEEYPEILSIVIICDDKAGIRGKFEARFVKK